MLQSCQMMGMATMAAGEAAEGSNLAGQHKAVLLHALLQFEIDVIFSEADVVWMHDPTEYLEQYAPVQPHIGSMPCTSCPGW